MTVPPLHAGGIGWDEILVTVIIVVAIAAIAFWIDRGRAEKAADHNEPQSNTDREKNT